MKQSITLMLSASAMALNLHSAMLFGGKVAVTCSEDDSIRVCHGGTYGCWDDGEDVCDQELTGYETQISCKDGSKHFCYSGTQHCADNDEAYCGADANGLA